MPMAIPVDQQVPILGELSAPACAPLPVDRTGKVDLTIHHRMDTHHGANLRILGHAAEYLVESRRFMMSASKADNEAVHILMLLSRQIFDEYAEAVAFRKRFHDWLMDRTVQRCA